MGGPDRSRRKKQRSVVLFSSFPCRALGLAYLVFWGKIRITACMFLCASAANTRMKVRIGCTKRRADLLFTFSSLPLSQLKTQNQRYSSVGRSMDRWTPSSVGRRYETQVHGYTIWQDSYLQVWMPGSRAVQLCRGGGGVSSGYCHAGRCFCGMLISKSCTASHAGFDAHGFKIYILLPCSLPDLSSRSRRRPPPLSPPLL